MLCFRPHKRETRVVVSRLGDGWSGLTVVPAAWTRISGGRFALRRRVVGSGGSFPAAEARVPGGRFALRRRMLGLDGCSGRMDASPGSSFRVYAAGGWVRWVVPGRRGANPGWSFRVYAAGGWVRWSFRPPRRESRVVVSRLCGGWSGLTVVPAAEARISGRPFAFVRRVVGSGGRSGRLSAKPWPLSRLCGGGSPARWSCLSAGRSGCMDANPVRFRVYAASGWARRFLWPQRC